MGLGMKLTKKINTLGRKAENSVNKLGQKTNDVFKKVGQGINKVDNIASNAIDKTADLAQKAVMKSGAITDALRVGAQVGNAIVSNLNRAGLSNVPLVGTASSLAETGTNALAKGAKKLDQKRDKFANQIENARANAHLEKNNIRKKIEEQANKAQEQLSFA